MASNKNQHFIPQCYLRNFAIGGSRSAINLFNIDRLSLIEKASIKGQCSKPYFYGSDPLLEQAIQSIELPYTNFLKNLNNQRYRFTNDDLIYIQKFWLFQFMRTEAASKRHIEMIEEMGQSLSLNASEYKLEIKHAVQQSMRAFARSIKVINDLKICFIKNNTALDFITSDDPAVLTNRWHIQNSRIKSFSFGLKAAGIICILPITPKIMCILYDGDVYSIPNQKGWVRVNKDSEIKLLNQFQVLNARANLFIGNNLTEASMLEDYSQLLEIRSENRHEITYSVFDREENSSKSYRIIDKADIQSHEDTLMHCKTIFPIPPKWPMLIGWRHKAKAYSYGEHGKYIRKFIAEGMSDKSYQKVIIRK